MVLSTFSWFFNVFALVVVWELWRGLGISGKLPDALGDSGMLWGGSIDPMPQPPNIRGYPYIERMAQPQNNKPLAIETGFEDIAQHKIRMRTILAGEP